MGKLFGTDGIRGVANEEPMTPETVVKLGRAAAYLFKTKAGRHSIVIGKDTRLHGYMLECALTSGICSMRTFRAFTLWLKYSRRSAIDSSRDEMRSWRLTKEVSERS